jgi:hypothetical protein
LLGVCLDRRNWTAMEIGNTENAPFSRMFLPYLSSFYLLVLINEILCLFTRIQFFLRTREQKFLYLNIYKKNKKTIKLEDKFFFLLVQLITQIVLFYPLFLFFWNLLRFSNFFNSNTSQQKTLRNIGNMRERINYTFINLFCQIIINFVIINKIQICPG